jgi:hypothetical protein
MTQSVKTMTPAEARVWLTAHAAKLADSGKSLPEGVTVPGSRGRLSKATTDYVTSKSRKAVVGAPTVAHDGVKSKLKAYVDSGKALPEGVTFKAGRGRLSVKARDFANTL